ncbi:MAG TPA: hypothetical protein V6C76_07990 [Drouetiella sp.]
MQSKKLLSALFACLSVMAPTLAQGGSPLPGNGDMAPVPGADLRPAASPYPEVPQNIQPAATAATSAPAPGKSARTAYGHLPLTVKDAQNRLVELRNALAVSRPRDLQEPIYQLAEWLNDSAEAHNKMANAFAKHDELKAQYQAEKQIGVKFSQLKRDAQLLKADLLIAQKRYPEALGPLVDIVLADPTSATGKTAYQRLKDLGFSHDSGSSSSSSTTAVKSALPPSATPAPAEAESSTSVQTSVKGATVKTTATTATTTTTKSVVAKAPVRLSSKPVSRPISIATKRKAH